MKKGRKEVHHCEMLVGDDVRSLCARETDLGFVFEDDGEVKCFHSFAANVKFGNVFRRNERERLWTKEETRSHRVKKSVVHLHEALYGRFSCRAFERTVRLDLQDRQRSERESEICNRFAVGLSGEGGEGKIVTWFYPLTMKRSVTPAAVKMSEIAS